MNNLSTLTMESPASAHKANPPGQGSLPGGTGPRDPADAASRGRWRKGATILFGTALGISLYLAWQSHAGKAVVGCGLESGCGQILKSRWGVAAGVPVSLLGAGVYAALLLSSLRREALPLWQRRGEWGASGLVLGGALWFTIVQAFILHAFCPWCSAAHLLASAGVGVLWLARRNAPQTASGRPGLAMLALPLAGVAGLALLQSLTHPPEQIKQQSLSHSLVSDSGFLSLHGGQITLDSSALPAIGLPQAAETAVALTDFTCPHCRELHRTLTELAGQRPGQFRAVLLPAAYEPEGRELHRTMLALWRIDPERYGKLSEALVSGEVDPNAKAVLEWVQQGLNGRFYELAWPQSGWVQDTLRLGESLLALNGRESGVATLPQTMIRDQVLTGAPRPETLAALLDALPPSSTEALAAAPSPALEAAAPAAPAVLAAPAAPVPPTVPADQASGAAIIAFESATVDLGIVTKGEPAAKKIAFINSGKVPLTITNIKASCGCTTVEGWQQTVAPGQQGSFELKIDTARFNGAITKTVDVESNASNGMVRLTLKALIWSPVAVNPAMVSFGPVLKGTKIEPRTVEITVTDPEPLKIAAATCNNSYFQIEMKPIEEGRKYQLLVSVPELGDRPQNSEIVLALGHPKLNELKIPLYINPVDPMVVQPAQLSIPLASLENGSTASITVFCHDPALASLEVTDLAYSGGGDATVTFERQGNNQWGRIQFTLPAGFKPGDAKEAFVSFHTNHPNYAKITVPVRFIGSSPTAQVPSGTLIR